MKKLLVLVIFAGLLVGCGKDNGPKTTVCVNDSSYNVYSSAKQTMESEGDIAKVLIFEGILEFESKEQLDSTVSIIDASMDSVNQLEGVEVSYEIVNDTTIKDMGRYDLEAASLSTLRQLGLLNSDGDSEDAKLISVSKSVAALEKNGFTCTVE